MSEYIYCGFRLLARVPFCNRADIELEISGCRRFFVTGTVYCKLVGHTLHSPFLKIIIIWLIFFETILFLKIKIVNNIYSFSIPLKFSETKFNLFLLRKSILTPCKQIHLEINMKWFSIVFGLQNFNICKKTKQSELSRVSYFYHWLLASSSKS